MRPVRYAINTTLDGCVDHLAFATTEQVRAGMHDHFAAQLAEADALLYGRITWQMMSDGFRDAEPGSDEFADTLNAAKKYVASRTLAAHDVTSADWNSELVSGSLAAFVAELKAQPGRGIGIGGVQLPGELARLGLIDEYQFVVHPHVAGHGPYLLAGVALDLELVGVEQLGSGAQVKTYVPR